MSHTFKKPIDMDTLKRQAAREVDILATHIENQAMLDELLKDADPDMRAACLERMAPYLPFVPEDLVIQDCPQCGLRRGSMFPHDCVGPD